MFEDKNIKMSLVLIHSHESVIIQVYFLEINFVYKQEALSRSRAIMITRAEYKVVFMQDFVLYDLERFNFCMVLITTQE